MNEVAVSVLHVYHTAIASTPAQLCLAIYAGR